jgi:hypothetical protein
LEAPETSDEESDFGASDASDDYSGSGSGSGGDESDEGVCTSLRLASIFFTIMLLAGDDWDELERKAAKCK